MLEQPAFLLHRFSSLALSEALSAMGRTRLITGDVGVAWINEKRRESEAPRPERPLLRTLAALMSGGAERDTENWETVFLDGEPISCSETISLFRRSYQAGFKSSLDCIHRYLILSISVTPTHTHIPLPDACLYIS